MTGKQRAALRAKAMDIKPIFNIGKDGLSDGVLSEISKALDDHELIKINILKNSFVDAKSAINEIAETLNAEPIQAIGGKMVLYRFSTKDGAKHIEF